MFWIDAVLILVCGWMGGTISTLVIRYVMEGKKPLDGKMMPVSLITPAPTLAGVMEQIGSPYAPKAKEADLSGGDRSEAIKRVWRAAKKEQSTHWKEKPKPPYAPPPPSPTPPPASLERPAVSPSLLPHVPWGG